jgi:hypothetical protein
VPEYSFAIGPRLYRLVVDDVPGIDIDHSLSGQTAALFLLIYPGGQRLFHNPSPAIASGRPRIGERLDEFEPREVRRILVGRYEI